MGLSNEHSFLLVLIVLSWVALRGEMKVAMPAVNPNVSVVPKIRVEIFNELPTGESFNIHCKSGDDDLGNHVVGPGQNYWFQFRINFWVTTLFFCRASWRGGQVEFDIFRVKRDILMGRCYDFCRWEARPDAIVGVRNDGTDRADIFFPCKR